MRYSVKTGESPAIIARRFGLPMSKLIGANPHKPTTIVAGQQTWRQISRNETINVPVGVGDLGYSPANISGAHSTIRQGSRGTDVATWQSFLGLTADGIFGSNTDAATRSYQRSRGLTADGVVGPKTWAAAQGDVISQQSQAAQLQISQIPVRSPTTRSVVPAAPGAPHALIQKGSAGPDVALWQTIVGVKADGIFGPATDAATRAWQSRHGLVADGKVGPKTWAAALGGSAPSAAPAPVVTPASVPAAVRALASIDPCYSGNAEMVCAAQAALKVGVDGKYGVATAAAAKRVMPSAPAACSPRPTWWTPVGRSNCGGAPPPVSSSTPSGSASQSAQAAAQAAQVANQAAQAAQAQAAQSPQAAAAAQAATQAAQAATQAAQAAQAAPSDQAAAQAAQVAAQAAQTAQQAAQAAGVPAPGPSQPIVAAPEEKKGLSTGAMVAGALGAAALVGVIAVAATSKKKPGRHAGSRKSSHRKPAKRAKKRR